MKASYAYWSHDRWYCGKSRVAGMCGIEIGGSGISNWKRGNFLFYSLIDSNQVT